MSFTVNGNTFVPESATTHATNILNTLNTYLLTLSIPPVAVSPNNALWLMSLANGTEDAEYDINLLSASNSLNPALCDDNQLLNLLPIAGTSLYPATYSTLNITVTATSAGSAVVPSGTIVNFIGADSGVWFTTVLSTTITASTAGTIACICNTPGPISVSSGSNVSLPGSVANVATVTNSSTVLGVNAETVAQCRSRIVAGNSLIGLNAAISGIRALSGIQYAQIYFNISNSVNLILNGITIPPRNAYIVISGTDIQNLIGTTYFKYMTAPTPSAAYSSTWTTASGQTLTAYYNLAGTSQVYAQIYYDPNQPTQPNYTALIQQAILNVQGNMSIGTDVTSAFILQALAPPTFNVSSATITGAELSLDYTLTNWAVATNVATLTFANNTDNVTMLSEIAVGLKVTVSATIGNIPAGTYVISAINTGSRTVSFPCTATTGSGSASDNVHIWNRLVVLNASNIGTFGTSVSSNNITVLEGP